MEVHLNGDKLCTAGVTSDAALSATIDVVESDSTYEVTLRVGGLEKDEFVIWSDRNLSVGDEISIRIVETECSDRPQQRLTNHISEP